MVDEFDVENVELANHYMYRYKLFKLVPQVLDLDFDDITVFMIIEEELGSEQAVHQIKMEQKARE